MNEQPRIDDLLPHRGRARFLTAIVEIDEAAILGEAQIPLGSPYASLGRVPAFVALEAAAQASAVLEGWNAARAGSSPTRSGYLVRVRDVQFSATELSAPVSLRVSVRRTGQAGEVRMYATEIFSGDALVLRGSFSVFAE